MTEVPGMYARVFSFQSTPEKRSAIEAMADELYTFTKTLPGFVSATYMVSQDECTYSSVTLWETRGAATSAGDSIRERVGAMLQDIAVAPPQVAINEVYRPNS
ncbi:MAG: hypothetical protein KDJ24_12875 [Gammaproteobacteria bacterium]|nr:hypothetical protein [Gammaproteobacteria bacterium]